MSNRSVQIFSLLIVILTLLPYILAVNESYYDWYVTQVNVKKVVYKWTITNFILLSKENGEYMNSPVFPNNDNNHKWYLHLYPYGHKNTTKNYFALYLWLNSGSNVTVECNFGIVNSNNEIAHVKSFTYTFLQNKNLGYGYEEFIKRDFVIDKTNNLLPNGNLTLYIEININSGTTNISGHCKGLKSEPFNTNYADNFAKLLEDESFSDVTLKVDQYEFQAHRAILASRSPVFYNKFKNMTDNTNNIIEIADIDPKMFKEVLRFIYTGKVENIEKIAEDLLPIAIRYHMEELTNLCEEILCRNINTSNAINILNLADSNNAEDLKKVASHYIAAHALQIVNTPSFKAMEVSRSHPMLHILRALGGMKK